MRLPMQNYGTGGGAAQQDREGRDEPGRAATIDWWECAGLECVYGRFDDSLGAAAAAGGRARSTDGSGDG
jgi:hypothetical protein